MYKRTNVEINVIKDGQHGAEDDALEQDAPANNTMPMSFS